MKGILIYMDNFLELEEKNFDIYMKKINNRSIIESSNFEITILESQYDESVIMEAEKTFKDKMTSLLNKVLTAISKFIYQVKIEISTKIQQMKINKKFSELKDIMAKKRSNLINGHVDMLDTLKYKQYYKRFMNAYISEVKSGLSKDFSSSAEFDEWKIKMQNKLLEFQYTLTDNERWKLSTAVDNALMITDKNLKSRNSDLDEINRDGERALKEIHKSLKDNSSNKAIIDKKDIEISKKRKDL